MPRGIGNANDLVGRFYMCHVAGTDWQRCRSTARRIPSGMAMTWPRTGLIAAGEYPCGRMCRKQMGLGQLWYSGCIIPGLPIRAIAPGRCRRSSWRRNSSVTSMPSGWSAIRRRPLPHGCGMG